MRVFVARLIDETRLAVVNNRPSGRLLPDDHFRENNRVRRGSAMDQREMRDAAQCATLQGVAGDVDRRRTLLKEL